MHKVGDKYRIQKQIFGWHVNEILEIAELDQPPGYVDIYNGYSKITIKLSDLDEYIAEGTFKLEEKQQDCYTCNWTHQNGFQFDYEICSRCGKVRKD